MTQNSKVVFYHDMSYFSLQVQFNVFSAYQHWLSKIRFEKYSLEYLFYTFILLENVCILGFYLFSASTVKVTSPEKVAMINFEWPAKPHSSESLATSTSSTLLAAVLDPDISEPCNSARIVRRTFRVGNRVIAYLQSHSTVLATLCSLVSCRKSRQTSTDNSGQEKLTECFADYYKRTAMKNIQHNGCTFVRELNIPCDPATGLAGETPVGGIAAADIDENLRDYIFRRLKHQLPTLKRFLIQFLSPLMPGATDPMSDPFWLLCSRRIPDELCAVLPSLFADRYFVFHVYRHISRLLQIHSLHTAGLSKLSGETNCPGIGDIFRLFEVVPSSVMQNSIMWTALRDFVVVSAVKGGSLSPAYALRVCDPDTRCRLLMSTMTRVDLTETSSFVSMLKSCLTGIELPEFKRVAEKRIITEKLHTEVIII